MVRMMDSLPPDRPSSMTGRGRSARPLAERFWWRVEPTGFCWNWTGARDAKGYGKLSADGRPARAHRVAYELLVGPIPDGLQIDHLCRNTSCVNPDHLETVTGLENMRRRPSHHESSKTRCVKGHPFDEENTYNRPTGGRTCKECSRVGVRASRTRKAATRGTTWKGQS